MENTLAPAYAKTRDYNLTVTPQRVAVVKVWDAMLRGARQYVESYGFVGVHNTLKSSMLKDFDWYLDFHKNHDVKLHSGAGIGLARVAQFILGQADIRRCVPFLINRHNAI
ncbi:amino acid--tRNA ligase-related protein [Hymenobacter weizhouensis]|uniref:amino acid--tRNA ligase-related protein n=1 Tax=Hymenobacter sp. YIM 151500-1 TaxID=2987689 RepID=UPI002227EB28|nr:amino acid--tRNA ligase-related protein [Hymenobacter sp. YIM 151500-1]UYZ62660.1 hypothetical protein OIS53_16865 [Hymenobacter sp. YIM 151500-1]